MKTKKLGRKHFEHLQNIGYTLSHCIETMMDSPYIFLEDDIVRTCNSALTFSKSERKFKTQQQILKLRPINEKKDVKKMSQRDKLAYKMLSILNNSKNSKITGYDVSWTIQKQKYDEYHLEILPISPHACGSISMEHLDIILNFAKENPLLSISISYTDWNEEKKRYGTSTPCIVIW